MDIATGPMFPTGNTYLESRLLFSIEPKYDLTKQFSLGIRLEVAPNIDFAGTSNPWVVKNVFSPLLTGDYFFTPEKFRPFLGIGAGAFKQKLSNDGPPPIEEKEVRFGVMIRGGFERKRLRIGLEYNTAFSEQIRNVSYISIKIGVFLWGNPK